MTARSSSTATSIRSQDRPDTTADELFIDQAMRDNAEMIALTIFLFLLTHAPASPGESLKGMFAHGDTIAEACHVPRARPSLHCVIFSDQRVCC